MLFLYWNFCTELYWFCLTDWVAATSCNIMRLIWPQPTRSKWKNFSKLPNVFVHMMTIILSNLQFEANTFILMIVWLALPVTLVKIQLSGCLTITRPTSTPDILAVKISDYLRSEWPKAAARRISSQLGVTLPGKVGRRLRHWKLSLKWIRLNGHYPYVCIRVMCINEEHIGAVMILRSAHFLKSKLPWNTWNPHLRSGYSFN